jgi:hypothetical protein
MACLETAADFIYPCIVEGHLLWLVRELRLVQALPSSWRVTEITTRMTRRLHGVGMFHTHCRGSKDTLCSLRAPKGVIRIPQAETVITRVSCREKLFTNKRKVGKFYFRWIGGLKEYSDGGGFAKGA